jgi:hypothetical protein
MISLELKLAENNTQI